MTLCLKQSFFFCKEFVCQLHIGCDAVSIFQGQEIVTVSLPLFGWGNDSEILSSLSLLENPKQRNRKLLWSVGGSFCLPLNFMQFLVCMSNQPITKYLYHKDKNAHFSDLKKKKKDIKHWKSTECIGNIGKAFVLNFSISVIQICQQHSLSKCAEYLHFGYERRC